MLIQPCCGWTTVSIGDFNMRASYLTDVPGDCLNAFIHSFESDLPAAIEFDAEGWEFTLISDFYSTYIILKYDEPKLIEINIGREQLALELIDDIENNIYLWSQWQDDDSIKENKEYLCEKIQCLKLLIDKI